MVLCICQCFITETNFCSIEYINGTKLPKHGGKPLLVYKTDKIVVM